MARRFTAPDPATPTRDPATPTPESGRAEPGPADLGACREHPELVNELRSHLRAATAAAREPLPERITQPLPAAPAAHAMVAHRGRVVANVHTGYADLFNADGALLAEPRTLGPRDVFDVASLTKIFVAVAALSLIDDDMLHLGDRVADHLPEFTGQGREEVTVQHLLTHTSGLPAVFDHWEPVADRAERIAVVLAQQPQHPPGRVHTYSCVGYQLLGLLLERRTGRSLPELLAGRVTVPLALSDTGFDAVCAERTVPTEYQTSRGLVRGRVHDEAAWVLGRAGNAGVFSTVADVLDLTEAIRTATGPVSPWMRGRLSTDALDDAQRSATGYGQAVGLRVSDESFMGEDSAGLLGHTGFTGTSMVIDPARELSIVLLTNRVHPYRTAFTVQPLRRAVVAAAQRWADQYA
ncbi:MAG TPA: serine hydrolase domain-containing protein [Beutenbergiaceae bacterium]|nr:serine hydrolase domain-containing protein [Beutenbergiaceae bacterium]